MKIHFLKIWLLMFCVAFTLFSCEKDTIESEVTTTQSQRPQNQQNLIATEDAKDIAVSFLNLSGNNGRSVVTKDDIKEVQTIVNDDETPIMYAVNLKEDNGFVVLSASFLERPILAYSEKGNFDFETIGNYNGVVDWAYTTYLTINQRIENKEEPNDEVAEQWEALGYQAKIPEGCYYSGKTLICPDGTQFPPTPKEYWYETIIKGPLMSTTWNQRLSKNPNATTIGYNNFIRYYNCSDGIAPAGCVTVAMGQIMKYHNHPNIYNINTMPNTVNSGNHTSNGAINIAYLLKDIGNKVNMDYTCDSSGAYSSNARNAFVSNYGYDASTLVNFQYYTLVQNIQNNRPVYIDGCRDKIIKTKRKNPNAFGWIIESPNYTYSYCHAWVVDGYQQIKTTILYSNNHVSINYAPNGLFYCNWGWGGNLNGWYYYNTWNNEQNQNVHQVDYIYSQHMIHNIKPKNN